MTRLIKRNAGILATTLALCVGFNVHAATEIDGRMLPRIEWDTQLKKFQFDDEKFIGQRFTAVCPPAPGKYEVKGEETDFYPSENSICDAGFRAGVIDSEGGPVTVQLATGMSLEESLQNRNIKGSARTLLVISDATINVADELQTDLIPRIKWDTKFTATGLAYKQLLGQQLRFDCPSAPSDMRSRRVVGTDFYAFSSMVCRAAVHAGHITNDGGHVTVQLNPKQKLSGSIRNGMETKDGSSGLRALSFVN